MIAQTDSRVAADTFAAGVCLCVVLNSGAADTAGAGALCYGIQQTAAAAGEVTEVAINGICKATYGQDTVTEGMVLASDAAGKLVEAGSADFPVAVALEAGDDEEVREVVLRISPVPLA